MTAAALDVAVPDKPLIIITMMMMMTLYSHCTIFFRNAYMSIYGDIVDPALCAMTNMRCVP